MADQRYAHEDYTIGWICALPKTELVAAAAMLDEKHPILPAADPHDTNSYLLGRIGDHNVVIACLLEETTGKVSAATVATDMIHSFPSIRFGMMVGIGGGVPRRFYPEQGTDEILEADFDEWEDEMEAAPDIRLGDVVVSLHTKSTEAVVQYDFGKSLQEKEFVHTGGKLNEPPRIVLNAVAQLQANHVRAHHKIPELLSKMLKNNPDMIHFQYPGLEKDRLFRSDVVHVGERKSCRECCGVNDANIVKRNGRSDTAPKIHYGTVGSADQVMKDAILRDQWALKENILCFEIEAAGLIDSFPCLVIRGICDYADSHKNKVWQPYASATAAAYAKELLLVIPRQSVTKLSPVKQLLNLAEQIEAMDPGHGKAFEQRESHHHGQIMQHLTEDHRRCLQAFKTSTYEKFKNINPNRVERTCEWVLNSSQYLRWWNTTGNDLLWISADPGCGKSVLAKFLIDEVFGISDSDVLVIYFFFKDNEEQNNLATALCAVLHRLFSLRPQLLQHALPFWERSKEKIQYELDDMWRILIAATSDPICGNTVCVFDALDECYNWDQKQLIERLREFHVQRPASQYNWLKFLVTSRPYYDIQDLFQPVTKSFPQIHLRGEEENDQIRKEISLVVKTRMAELREKLNLNTRLHERLEKELLNMKHRTYLWLYLAIGDIESTLKNSFRPDRESIPLIPRNVTEAYNKILDRINPEQEATVKRLLQIIVGARRPLTIWEMAMALGIATSQGTRLAREAGIQPDGLAEKIRQLCGLFVYISNSRIYLIHQTAREFLIRNYNGSIWHLDLVETENEMSQICVKYLLMDDLVSHDGESARSLLRYSSQYWADHFRHIPSPRKDLLQSVYKLYDLSNERFTLWFPIFWELVMLHEERPTMNAIHLAAFNGHQNVLSRLDMSSNGGIDQADSSKTNSLHWACLRGNVEVVQLLLGKGADVNARGGKYGSALQAASQEGHLEIAQLLLEKGADVNTQGGYYGNALQAASHRRHLEIAQLLLEKGADVNTQGGDYGSALQAASQEGHLDIAQLLLEKGADVNTQGGNYGSALQAASQEGHLEIAQLLLEKGADVNTQGGDYGNALQAASAEGHLEIAQLLLEEGADVNTQGGDYGSALQAASAEGHLEIAQLLLGRGANINVGSNIQSNDKRGRTPLSWAAGRGDEGVVRMLLAKDVNPDSEDYSGRTPISYALEKGHQSIVNLLYMESRRRRERQSDFIFAADVEASSNADLKDRTHDAETVKKQVHTDSGYATQHATTLNTTFDVVENPEDAGTVYSDESSLASKEDSYMTDLAHDLYSKVSSEELDENCIKRILAILPELLKDFALRIGHNAHSRKHSDIMVFVRKHRSHIVKLFKERYYHDKDPRDDRPNDPNIMPLKDIMNRWYNNQDHVDTFSNQEPLKNGVGDINPGLQGSRVADYSDGSADGFDEPNWDSSEKKSEVSETEMATSTTKNLVYQEVFLTSPAYKWLVANVRREIFLNSTERESMETIKQNILDALPSSRRVNRGKPSESFKITFAIDWDPHAFVEEQGFTEEPDDAIESAITLTGSLKDAQALTCAQYLNQTWPLAGEHTLRLVSDLVRTGPGHWQKCTLPDATILIAGMYKSKLMVEASGTRCSIAETGEQLAWLCAALRTSPREHGVIICTPFISDIHNDNTSLPEPEFPSCPGILCKIDVIFQKEVNESEPSNGQCWHRLFRNPVIVKGYPILRRQELDTGLEIPLNVMARLAQAQRVNTFNGKIFVKGFSTMLVPTKRIGDLLIWHLFYNEDGSRISYLDSTVAHCVNLNVQDLEKTRHILGWCLNVQFYAGTADATYTTKSSMLPRCHEGCVLEKTSLSSGKIVTGGSFAVGYRDTRISRSGYVDKLKWIDQRYVVFWDEESKRGWLVNGTTTLLHLLRASLEHDSTDKFSSIFLFKPEQMKEAFEPYIAGSAIKVLLDPENLALRIYPDKKDYIRFEHRVDHFYDVLEQMMDYQYYRLSTADKDKGNLNFMPRTYLEGWNFEDLARGRDPLCPRVTKLRTYGKSWVDFTRDIHAVTLFGKGFGEIIRPTAVSSCAYWAKLPEQKYYLAAGVSDLREIMAHHGGDEEANPVQLTDSTIWHNPGSTFELCRCTEKTREEHSDFTQVLLPLTFREKLTGNIPVPMNDHAAVVFGYSSKFRWLWNDSGDPEEGEPPSPSTESETNFHDSGIGRSPTLSTVLTLQNESLTPNHYKVGIVCALHSELLAVRALFDITHENLNNLDIPSQDPNHYVLGRIGLHNVVAAGLPFGEYGTNSAAVVVTHMKRSFPELEYCLLVGIGGGAPSEKHDIRLGDIVVSKPTDTYPGVIQYDLGKTHENGVFELTGSLQRPPAVLMTAITSLLADPNPSPAPLQSYLKDIKMRWPGYKHPGPKDDILFATETVHDSRYETCKQCYGPRISRIYRPHNHPRIHYGLIASGNQVMKSAKIRDRLRDEHDILCFEMEAAGVMNTIPCLVIRGICDYADSHKNKSWQGYAAAAAAAYAKLLLTAVRNINSLESTPAGLETVNKNHHKKRGLAFRESLLAKKSRKT